MAEIILGTSPVRPCWGYVRESGYAEGFYWEDVERKGHVVSSASNDGLLLNVKHRFFNSKSIRVVSS